MAQDNYPQTPTDADLSKTPELEGKDTFPYALHRSRINTYDYYEKLFMGEHFSAFSIKINNNMYGKEYEKIRYVVVNFAGLITRIIADLLFIEPPKIQMPDGGDQAWVDEFVKENNLRTQNYESALTNSYLGDSLFKFRINKRRATDTVPTVIVEEITPKIWFPEPNPYNIKAEPEKTELAWKVGINGKEYLRKEIHTPGLITNELWLLDGTTIKMKVGLDALGEAGLNDTQEIKIKDPVIIHIPNFRPGSRFFGVSDYYDLDTLFYAINNRLSKIDNILDKHSDPILSVPDGILDEEGKVKREALGLFSRPKDATNTSDPAYITWDASLESGFSEIENLIKLAGMVSDTAPALLGLDTSGQAESGRALKYKLIRTIAKAQRKQLYYTIGLANIIYTAQKLAKAYDVGVGDKNLKLKGEPMRPEIVWADGLPADMSELIDVETKRIDAGLSSTAESIMRLDDVDEKTAADRAKKIKDENALDLPTMNPKSDFPPKNTPTPPGK
jgi:hypothetical protein